MITCPICGWQGLTENITEPMGTHEICACCGTEFGFDLSYMSEIERVRNEWLKIGAPWFDDFSDVYPAKPEGWSKLMAEAQIRRNLPI